MKTSKWLFVFVCLALIRVTSVAQCGTSHTLNYDTSLLGTGGTDNPYTLTFPKFNSMLGTLTDVKVVSVLTINYQYDIENTSTSPKTIKLRVNRDDEITSSVLADPIDNSYSMPSAPLWISHPLGATDGSAGSGPDFLSVPSFALVTNDTIINTSASNPADFLGSGTISFDYSSAMSLTSTPAGSANITNTAAADQIKFILQYVYCDNVILTREITSFDASKRNGYVDLRWVAVNALSAHRYEVQKSTDGKNFETVAVLSPNNGTSYQYNYIPLANENGKLFFRIHLVVNGTSQYSETRMVSGQPGDASAAMRLIPNPTSGSFAISLDRYPNASDWKIEMYNLKGQVIMQRQLNHSTVSKVQINEQFPKGIYFILLTDKSNNRKFVERLIID